jgi:hypothetical protein
MLCTRGKSGSSIPVMVLMRASVIIALDGFCDYTFKVLQMLHIDWPLSSSNDGLSFLFAYLSCSWHNMDLVFYQIDMFYILCPTPTLSQHNWLAQTH